MLVILLQLLLDIVNTRFCLVQCRFEAVDVVCEIIGCLQVGHFWCDGELDSLFRKGRDALV